MSRTELGALAAFAALGWRRAAAERAATLGRLLLYGLILVIFWELWQATPLAELAEPGTDARHLFWYMAVTECVAIATGYPYRALEIAIQSGEIASALTRPLPYALATLAEWAGATGHRLLVLLAAGVALGVAVTGTFPVPLADAPALLLSIALASLIVLLCQLQLGYAAAWTGSAAPLFWIWQKLMFVCGGLIIPLTLYPAPLGTLAKATPFAAMLFAPGSLVLEATPAAAAAALAWQLAWLVPVAAAAFLVDRAAARRFAVRGI